jgi:hypothetical protein
LCYYAFGGFGESEPVVAHHVTTQHSEHFRSGTLDDGKAGEQSRPQVERQDLVWPLKSGPP